MKKGGDVIIKPIITEQSVDNAGKGKFTFRVSLDSSKNVIRRAVEEKFKVNVVSVATLIVKGGRSRAGKRRIETSQTPWKKAIVELKSGQKIELFDIGTK